MAGDLKAKVTFLADTKGLLKGVDAVQGRFNKLGKSLQTHAGTFLRAGAALGAAVGGLAAQGIAYGTTIDRMAESTGQAHEEMSRLVYSAELYHGSAQKVEKGVRSLAQKMQYAKDGLETYRREFVRAGIDVDAWGDKMPPVNDILLELADSFATNADGTEVLASATVLLGGRQAELIPWLKQGSAAIREQFGEADKLGLVLSSKTAKSMEELGTSLKKIKIAMRGVGVVVADVVLPVVEDLAFKAVAAMMAFQKWSPEAKKTATNVALLGTGGLLALGVIGKFKQLGLGGILASWGTKLAGVATALGVVGGMGVTVGVGSAVALGLSAKATALLADESNELHGEYLRLLARQKQYVEMVDAGAYSDEMLAQAHIALAQEFQNLQQKALDAAGGMEETGEEADALATFMDKIKAAFDEAAGSVEDARDPFAEFLTTLGDGVPLLEKYDLLMQGLAPHTLAAAAATSVFVAPLRQVGQTIAALPDPVTTFGERWLAAGDMAAEGFGETLEWLTDIEDHLTTRIPYAGDMMVDAFARVYGQLGALDKATWKTLKEGMAGGMKNILDMYIDMTLGKLLATKIQAIADLGMVGFLNPAAWGYIAVVGGIYGAAKAAISGINSFDESAVITRGGSLSGNVSIGDVIVSPDAMKNFMKGGGGGRTVIVNATFAGSYVGDSAGFRDDIDYLAERFALARDNG